MEKHPGISNPPEQVVNLMDAVRKMLALLLVSIAMMRAKSLGIFP